MKTSARSNVEAERVGSSVVVTTPDELRAIVRAAVRDELEARGGNMSDEWLDTAAAAKLLGVCGRTVANLAKDGRLAVSRVGRLLRFRRSDVLAFLAKK